MQLMPQGAMPPDIFSDEDVVSLIDLRTMVDAREWAATAMEKRPWREDFFQCFVTQLHGFQLVRPSVLELGSGPGFLAKRILESVPGVRYTMLDFSPAMHELARERLGSLARAVRQVQVDFKRDGWAVGLGSFDAVVTIQAVHEVRHKKHVVRLHEAVRSLLNENGRYFVCDHYIGQDGMTNGALYMTIEEQRNALQLAGFTVVTVLMQKGGLVLHSASQ
jgi:SAM-dependent methyltransferase